jgi:hypothetical protein
MPETGNEVNGGNNPEVNSGPEMYMGLDYDVDLNSPSNQGIPTELADESADVSVHAKGRGWKKATLGAAIVGGTAVALGVELSPINESVRIPPAADVFRDTRNEAAVAGYVGGLTLAIELPATAMLSLGLDYEKDRVHRMVGRVNGWMNFLNKENNSEKVEQREQPSELRQKISDTGIAFGIGPTVLVAKKHFQNPERAFKDNLETGIKSSLLVSGIAGSIGLATALLIKHGEKLGAFRKPAEEFVDLAADWKFWMVTVGVINGVPIIKNKIKEYLEKRKQNNVEQ